MIEVYKDIPGWEGIYRVSDHGNIISLDRIVNGRQTRGRMLKLLDCKGTTRVNLCTGVASISKTYTVGHVVLLAFVGPRNDGMRAKHKNGDARDNTLENLYWGPHSPNAKKAIP